MWESSRPSTTELPRDVHERAGAGRRRVVAGADRRSEAADGHPVHRLRRLRPGARARGARPDRHVAARRRGGADRAARAARHRTDHRGHRAGAGGGTDGAALLPLRRPAGRRRVLVADAAVHPDRDRRRGVRAGRRRRQVQPDQPPGRPPGAACPRAAVPGDPQDRLRGAGGVGQRLRRVPGAAPRALRRRRDGDRRHGQHRTGRPDLHHRPARDGRGVRVAARPSPNPSTAASTADRPRTR